MAEHPALYQFGPPFTDTERFTPEEQGSLCGPIALHGAMRALGAPAISVDAIMGEARARDLWSADLGMLEATAGLPRLAARFGVELRRVVVPVTPLAECPTILSTPKHYYLAVEVDRDRGLFVGPTGRARIGGGEWMTHDRISELDGGVTALWSCHYPSQAITDALNGAWHETQLLDRPRVGVGGRRQSAEMIRRKIATLKTEMGWK